MPDLARSFFRTVSPVIAGWLLAWLINLGVEVDFDQTTLTAVIVTLLTAAYYLVARLLERWKPGFGVLLLAKGQPTYDAQHGG